MIQQSKPLPPLSVARSQIIGEQAFEGDLLARRNLAEKLTSYLDRLKEGAVLAIDAQWGDGKTWFGRNWARHLEDNGHKVIFIDAFEQDYIEDPFLLIAAEIAEILDDENDGKKEFQEKATGVMKAILPVGTKVLINIAGRVFLGSSDVSAEIKDTIEAASDTTADATSEWIKNKIQDHAQEKASLKHFRTELKAVANAQKKPVVIFIDELDRCRPTFAVRLIERIKHFFDVPNVVFVLLINRDQLEKAIKGVYGAETDAAAYLGKFVNFFFFLPKHQLDARISNSYVKSYVFNVLSRYNFDLSHREHNDFGVFFTYLANHFNLSLRDIEKCIALYAFAQPIHKDLYHFLAYEITLKIAKPELFRRLLKGEILAHEETKALIATLQGADWFLEVILSFHTAHIANNFTEFSEKVNRYLQSISCLIYTRPQNLFTSVAEFIDLPMEMR